MREARHEVADGSLLEYRAALPEVADGDHPLKKQAHHEAEVMLVHLEAVGGGPPAAAREEPVEMRPDTQSSKEPPMQLLNVGHHAAKPSE
jgi:hypothetical protein